MSHRLQEAVKAELVKRRYIYECPGPMNQDISYFHIKAGKGYDYKRYIMGITGLDELRADTDAKLAELVSRRIDATIAEGKEWVP